MQLSRFVRLVKRRGIPGVLGGPVTRITIPPKGRIRSPMPVREARRYRDSLDRFWVKVQKLWKIRRGNALRELTEQAQELGLY